LNAKLGDVAILVNLHILILDPGRSDIPESFDSARNALSDGIIETFRRGGFDLTNSSDRHNKLLSFVWKTNVAGIP